MIGAVFCVVAQRRLERTRRFGVTYRPHLQRRKANQQATTQQQTGKSYSSAGFLFDSLFNLKTEMLIRNVGVHYQITKRYNPEGSPLWSSGQSSWPQIQRPGFDSRHYQKKSSGSETGSTQPREYN
jgi:hypothetical protein